MAKWEDRLDKFLDNAEWGCFVLAMSVMAIVIFSIGASIGVYLVGKWGW